MFHKPVDTEYFSCPDYYQIIKNPIDLETISVRDIINEQHKLNLRLYSDLKDFIKDLRLMFQNCYKYNGRTHKLAQNCEIIEKRLEKYLDNLISEGKIKKEDTI